MHIDMLQKLIENLEKKIIQEKETEKKIYLILETIQYLDKKRENMSNYAKFKGMYNDPSDYDNDTKK